MVMNATHLLHS